MTLAEAVAAEVAIAAVVVAAAIDVSDYSHCADAVAVLIVPCCCRVFDVNDNDNDFVDFQA